VSALHAGSPIEEVAATVSGALAAAGITAVLSGGAAVQIYTEGLYVSRDLDFVSPAGHRELDAALRKLGFSRVSGRHYVHDAVPYTLEFPPWPLAVGSELIRDWMELPVGQMTVRILTPTQCVMDRLAAFYFWRDRQALDQAVLVATRHPVDLVQVERWSQRERHAEHFREFAANLTKAREGS
jgi:hypothetical protein